MRLKFIAAAIAFFTSANLFSIEVLVAPSDRDRLIKTRDGRQIRLNAGSELIRTDDGRLAVRRALGGEGQKLNVATKVAQARANVSADRWIWFAGAEGAVGSITRDYTIKTNEINKSVTEYETIDYEGKLFKTDGGTVKFSKDKSVTTFAVVGGLKDELTQNYYQLGYYVNDNIDEVAFSAQFGFESLAFFDEKIIPYARAVVGAGFEDGIDSLDPDSFVFGGGLGATYILSPNVEIYGGLEYLLRNFGSASGTATKSGGGSITYGSLEREETETRFYVGARYLFR
ncbi:MAG: hypothetical protein LBF86_05855 [Helicobacteraceae bacterium]|jgi:hypothetical protein|nr:hypothetical protein [Helicobacteraceae bacterium]